MHGFLLPAIFVLSRCWLTIESRKTLPAMPALYFARALRSLGEIEQKEETPWLRRSAAGSPP